MPRRLSEEERNARDAAKALKQQEAAQRKVANVEARKERRRVANMTPEQGQSYDAVGLYLPQHSKVFGHGQLYVATSRSRSKKGIKVSTVDKDNNVNNVVYKEVL